MPLHPTLKHIAGAFVIVATTACSSVRPTKYAGLESSRQLVTSPDDRSGRVPFSYTDGSTRKRYDQVLLEPVAVYTGGDGQFDEKISPADKEALAAYSDAEFREELATAFELTDSPGPNALRIKVTLTGAKSTTKVLALFTRFDLGGAPYNMVQSARGKEGIMTGWVMYAVEVYDSRTNRLLDAYVTKQYPNAMNVKANWGALTASRTGIHLGARELVSMLQSSVAR